VIAFAQGPIVNSGVSIKTRLAVGLSDVPANRVQLQQVVLNLVLTLLKQWAVIDYHKAT
jgi:hypothetical protein